MSSPFQKQFSAKSPLNQGNQDAPGIPEQPQPDPDAPGTPGQPGYEPPVLRYKEGDLMNKFDAEDHTDLNVNELSKIKKDERGQYMVTTGNDTIRPRFNSTKFFKTDQ